jgi:hypothetical protein
MRRTKNTYSYRILSWLIDFLDKRRAKLVRRYERERKRVYRARKKQTNQRNQT